MCFSASASFTAGIALLLCSIAALKQVTNKKFYMIALIPLIFGVQQLVEGFVWLSFSQEQLMPWRNLFSYIFVGTAALLWPIWVPISLYKVEPQQNQKQNFYVSIMAGVVFATTTLIYFFFYPLTTEIINCHIAYALNIPYNLDIATAALYLAAAALPFFLSSIKKMWLLGIALLISYAISYFFFYQAHVSMWCFFAAILSIIIVILLPEMQKEI